MREFQRKVGLSATHIEGVRLLRLGLLACGLTAASGCSSSNRPGVDTVVEPVKLAAALASPARANLKVLDARDAPAFAAGHAAGAAWVDLAAWKAASLGQEAVPGQGSGLDHRAAWHERIGALGVDGDDAVVVYDDGRMTEAARVWFILQHFGVAQAGVVNGGYPALAPLLEDGRIARGEGEAQPAKVTFRPRRGSGPDVALADRGRVLEDVRRGSAQVFDARTAAEYRGEDWQGNPRAGHIPKAVNLPHKDLLDEHGRLRPPAELAALLEKAGLQRGKPIITHCQSGGRASLAALAAERAGYGPVWNYYLSFGDWAADATCPIEAGE